MSYHVLRNFKRPSIDKDILFDTGAPKRIKLVRELLKNDLFLAHIIEAESKDKAEKQILEKRGPDSKRRSQKGKKRAYILEEIDAMSDREFCRMFRLNRTAFSYLLEKIIPHISSKNVFGKIHGEKISISPKIKFAATLRWLAGGSFYQEYSFLWECIEAIDKVLVIGFPLKDHNELKRIAQGFSRYSLGRMTGCVMAVDGWVCRTRMPTKLESKNQLCFRNRKGFWGIVVFAGCDHELRFLMWSSKCPGATNDSLCWDVSDFKRTIIDEGLFPPDFYIVSDEALSCTEIVLTPFGGRGLGDWRDSFNYHLSAMRQCIERAFGILVRRWGIFWRALQCDMSRWSLITRVCAKLHNICIDFTVNSCSGGIIEVMPEDSSKNDLLGVYMNTYDEENIGEFPTNQDKCSNLRLSVTLFLKTNLYRRPSRAIANSKA